MNKNIKILPFLLLLIYFLLIKINILSTFGSKLLAIILIISINVFLYFRFRNDNQNKINYNLYILLLFSFISTILFLYNIFKFKLI